MSAPVDAIVTSPPYLTAQDYWRSSKLEHAIVFAPDQDTNHIGPSIIGSGRGAVAHQRDLLDSFAEAPTGFVALRRCSPNAAVVAMNYLRDMDRVISELRKVLRKGGHCCLVLGDCQIAGIKTTD